MNWKQKASSVAESFLPACYSHDFKSSDMEYPFLFFSVFLGGIFYMGFQVE